MDQLFASSHTPATNFQKQFDSYGPPSITCFNLITEVRTDDSGRCNLKCITTVLSVP